MIVGCRTRSGDGQGQTGRGLRGGGAPRPRRRGGCDRHTESTHASRIEMAVRAGKAVWSVKPIALNIAETQRAVASWWGRTASPSSSGSCVASTPGTPWRRSGSRAVRSAGSRSSGRCRATRTPARVPQDQWRPLPRHGRAPSRPRPITRRRGRRGAGLGFRSDRRALPSGRRRPLRLAVAVTRGWREGRPVRVEEATS